MRIVQLICLLLVFTGFGLRAQSGAKDTCHKLVELKEVCILEQAEQEQQSFSFYKTSKLATTEDILSRMEGVNLIKRGAYGLEPGLRNYSGGQTNVTLDGMRIYGACTDKMDPVSIYVEPVNLESIQVAHGNSGAQNGSTIGGQVNFQLKEPPHYCDKKIHGQFSQSYASVHQGYTSNGALQQQIGKFSYRVSGARRDAGNYMAGGDQLIQHSGYHKSNVAAVLMYAIDSLQRIRVNYLGDWGRNIGYPALPMDVGKAEAQIYSLTHQLTFKAKRCETNELKVYYNSIYHQMDDTHRDEVPMHMDMPGWSKTMGVYDVFRTRKALQVRVDYHQTETRADMVMYPVGEPVMYLQTLPENWFSDLGLALKKEWAFKHAQMLEASFRGDYYRQNAMDGPGVQQWQVFNTDITREQTNFLKNGHLQYSKSFGQVVVAAFRIGYGERIPTSNERYGYYLFNRQDLFDYVGNLALKPERSVQAEWQFRYKAKNLEFSANFFYHLVNDYIYAYRITNAGAMTIGARGLKSYTNISKAYSRGTEISLKYRLRERLTYMSNAKYVYALAEDGKPLPLVAPFKWQQALRYHHRLWQAQVEYDYAAAQKRINPDYGDVVTPSFHLFNLRLARNFAIGKCIIQCAAACENIFDVNYREHLDIGQVPRFGRNFSLNLGLLF